MSVVSQEAAVRTRDFTGSLGRLVRHPFVRNALAFCLFQAAFYLAYRYGMSFTRTTSSPFWFPDSVLLCALLCVRVRWWWLPLIATLPIRLWVAVPPEIPLWFLMSAFVVDCAKAVLSATLLRRFLSDPFRFATVRDFGLYCLVAVLLTPALGAVGGAAARHGLGYPYWPSWEQWFLGDALAGLIITPIMFYWLVRPAPLRDVLRGRSVEAILLACGLLVSLSLAFEPASNRLGFADSRLNVPIAFLVWAAIRFGMYGASAAAALLSFFAIVAALSGSGPFDARSPADSAAALQQFLLLRVGPLYLVAVLIDQAHRVERSLRESEQRFRQMADTAPALIWMTGADGVCTFFNSGLLRFTGRSLEQQQGDGWVSGVHGADRQRCLATYRASFDARRPFELEYRLRRYDGEDRWMLDRGVPRYAPDGEFIGYIGCAIDVTDRRLNEMALRQSEERYREVVESQTDLVCRFLEDTTLTFVNEAYCRYLGREREELLGTKLQALLAGNTRESAMNCIREAALRREPSTWECEVLRRDGSQGWQFWVCHAIPGSDGSVQEFQAIGHDITDRKRVEEANRTLAHTARLAAVGEFTAMVAHEISQPLCAILGNAEAAVLLLQSDEPPLAELRDIVADIRDADLRADEAIRGIRALTQKREMQLRPLNLNDTVVDMLRLVAGDALHRRVHINLELAPDLPLVVADRVSVEQVLLNLVSNGMDAMMATPETERRLTVQTKPHDSDCVQVTVADRGHGIPAAQMGRLFDSFFTTKPQGMGLGLSMARSIIQAHQGRIWAESCAGGGAAFHFILLCCP